VPKRFAIPVTVLGVFLAMTLSPVVEAPLAIIPRVTPAPGAAKTAAPQTPATPPAPSAAKPAATLTPPAKHTVTVKFDYDFSRSPACTANLTAKCVQQFNVYDISGGAAHRIKLFSIPLPPNPSGQIRGITGTSPQLSWEPGTHFLAVTAQWPTGDESNPAVCTTTVQINP
jgi:hypothetical protein